MSVSLQLQNDRKAAAGSRRWFSKTLIAAYVVLGLVLWQTIHVIGGGEMPFLQSRKPQMGSTKLHMDRDAMSRKNRLAKEPVAAFFERAKRGMTEQEIRGMIADYEALGQMPNGLNLEECREYMEKRNDWHTAALTEALSLTSEQKQQVHASLTESLNQALKASQEAVVPEEAKENVDFISLGRQQRLAPELYYGDSNMAPWTLCDLTEDQLKLTYKPFLKMRNEKSNFTISLPLLSETMHSPYFDRSLAMHAAGPDEYIGYPTPSTKELGCSLFGTVSGGIIDVTNTFPLTPDQKLENYRNDLLTQTKLLHPAQLRLALLLHPGVGETIKSQLDKPWGQ